MDPQGWVGTGWGASGWDGTGDQAGGDRTVSQPSAGVQGEGQFDTAELLPTIADHHSHTVVAIGHPGREFHIRHIKITGWQGVGALWREGTDRQEVSQEPSPAPKGTVYPLAVRGLGRTALKGQWQGMP